MPGAKKSSSSTFIPNEEALMMIISMGFTKEQATKALKATVRDQIKHYLLNSPPMFLDKAKFGLVLCNYANFYRFEETF